jgi:hypothetical protein
MAMPRYACGYPSEVFSLDDLLRSASDWLEEMRVKFMARMVIYVRGSQRLDVRATIGRTIFRINAGYGLTERFEARDYLILANDLVLEGTPILPKAGDRIHESQGSLVFIYEVMAPGNEPHYRYSDGYRKTLRIHTKLIATEAAP